MAKKAIITGITGQDGAYLGEFLLQKGYKVYGLYRRVSSPSFWRLKELQIYKNPNLYLLECDITDSISVFNTIKKIMPDEIYNLAAQSFVQTSFEQPLSTMQINSLSVTYMLESIRLINPHIRFYQASTSEMFGKTDDEPQHEQTPFAPRSPYGISKLCAHWTSINYYESYNIFACSGILFNHESPLRGKEFVTRKITDGVAKIALNQLECIELGNIYAKRDWGFAKEYVEGMWKMLQTSMPDTFILSTGKAYSVKEFVTLAFEYVNIPIVWENEGLNEVAINTKNNRICVRISPKYYRPAEIDSLVGDYSKAEKILGWNPSCSLQDLCKLMMEADLQRNRHKL